MKKGILFLLLTLLFTGVATVLFVWVVKPHIEFIDIEKNGTETTAIVKEMASNTTVNGEHRFRLIFEFINDDGETIKASTKDAYSFNELNNINPEIYTTLNAEITIKYRGDKAVVIPYKPGIGTTIGLVFVIITGVIALIMLLLTFISFKHKAEVERIKSMGYDGTATYVNHTSNLIINGVHKYKIHYTYTDENGNFVQGKTGSKYYFHEAEAFAVIKNFPIKFLGSKSVIMLDKSNLIAEYQRAISTQNNQDYNQSRPKYNGSNQTYDYTYRNSEYNQSKTTFCKHCGAQISSDMQFCPECGTRTI